MLKVREMQLSDTLRNNDFPPPLIAMWYRYKADFSVNQSIPALELHACIFSYVKEKTDFSAVRKFS